MQVTTQFADTTPVILPGPVAHMRIGFFVPWLTKGRGGTEHVGQMMANAMAARGHDVTVFTFDDARAPARWPLDDGIELVHLPEAETAAADQRMVIEVASRNLGLLVGLHMNRGFARYVRCATKAGLPLVLSEHADPQGPALHGTFTPEERAVVFSGATLIHLVSEPFRSTLDDMLQDRIRVVPNTIRPPSGRAMAGKRTGPKTLLAVARLVPTKNIARLIEVFARLAPDHPDWRLRIVGDGPQRKELARLAKRARLGDRITLSGALDDPYPAYADAQLFVTGSVHEAFGLTACEASAHGLPVVGYAACAGLRGQVVHGETGLLASGGAAIGSLADELSTLMRDDTLRGRMGRAALVRYQAQYAPDEVHTAWERMFSEAAANRPIHRRPSPQSMAAVRLWDLVWGGGGAGAQA
jgi:glycosyltransferase involved in cell wall biosynthesis